MKPMKKIATLILSLLALHNTMAQSNPVDPHEWLEEIQRRSREIDDGSVLAVPFIDPLVRLERLRGGA